MRFHIHRGISTPRDRRGRPPYPAPAFVCIRDHHARLVVVGVGFRPPGKCHIVTRIPAVRERSGRLWDDEASQFLVERWGEDSFDGRLFSANTMAIVQHTLV